MCLSYFSCSNNTCKPTLWLHITLLDLYYTYLTTRRERSVGSKWTCRYPNLRLGVWTMIQKQQFRFSLLAINWVLYQWILHLFRLMRCQSSLFLQVVSPNKIKRYQIHWLPQDKQQSSITHILLLCMTNVKWESQDSYLILKPKVVSGPYSVL